MTVGEDILVFYNDKASFNYFVELMRAERHRLDADSSGALKYHIELVRLLALLTMGKNVFTEIKCHSLLTLDDIVAMVSHRDCIPEVKEVYISFLNHCYIDTEVEVKEIYTSGHMWSLFERSFLVDMARCASATHDRKHADTALEHYVTGAAVGVVTTFFRSPFSDQSTAVQTRQSVFVQLLQVVFRLSQCAWLSAVQRAAVETCIRTLSDMARSRSIAIPSDLDNQVSSLFNKPVKSSSSLKLFASSRAGSVVAARHHHWQQLSRESSQSQLIGIGGSVGSGGVRFDRSIIEGLQDIVVLLEAQLHPLVQAESSVIVDILLKPQCLFPPSEARRRCEDGKLIRRLIKHAERLLEDKEEKLCIQLLGTLRQMMQFDVHYGEKGDALRKNLLNRYFYKQQPLAPTAGSGSGHSTFSGKKSLSTVDSPMSAGIGRLSDGGITRTQDSSSTAAFHGGGHGHGPGCQMLSRAEMTLHQVQVHLDREGASDLVADLVMKFSLSPNVFMEAVQLGIALLEGGNPVIQRSFLTKLQSAETSPIFFKVFFDKMRDAQVEIKATMTVNTTEMASTVMKMTEMDQAAMASKEGDFFNTGSGSGGAKGSSKWRSVVSGGGGVNRFYPRSVEDQTTSTLSAVGSTLEDLLVLEQQRNQQTAHLRLLPVTTSVISESKYKLSPKVAVMLPVLRFLQLLCENHNRDLQVLNYNPRSYNS